VLAVLLTAALLVLPAVVLGQERLEVQPAGTVTWDEMLALEALAPRVPAAEPRVVPRMPLPPPREIGGLGPVPAPASPVPPEEAPGPSGPVIANTFAALGDNNTSIPPDTMGAAGPSHLMTMLNTQVRIQDKAGGIISTVSLSSFWTSGTGLSGDPFDPHVIYDSIDGRWLATVDADKDSTTSQVWFAISATNNPTGAWTFYGFDADAANVEWADYPGFGVNSLWIAITNNMFPVGGGVFIGPKMWVIEKADALLGGALTVNVFATNFDSAGCCDGSTLKPSVTYSAAEPTLYIVDNAGYTSGGTPLVRLSQITGTGPAPAWSVVPGSTFAGSGLFAVANDFEYTTIDAPQMGTATLIDAGDHRASDSVYRNGRLWFAHSGTLPNGAPTRNAVFWYQLDPAAMPAPIVQSGVLDGGGSVHHFHPSIAANSADDALIGFSRSSPSLFVEAVWASRFAADLAGTMTSGPTVLKSGEDSYEKIFTGDRVRWGDYSATCVDPVDDLSFWTIQEYAETDVGGTPNDDRWGTWWGTTGTIPTTTTTTTTIPPPIQLDDFQGAKVGPNTKLLPPLPNGVKYPPVPPKAVPQTYLPLIDQFGTSQCQITSEKILYSPTSKNGGTIDDPTLHYTDYRLKCGKGLFPTLPVATYYDQFWPGGAVVTATKPVSIMIPTGKKHDVSDPGGDPTPPPAGTNHYLCWAAKGPKFTVAPVVTSVDQYFAGLGNVTISAIARVCNPVNKNGEDPTAPGDPDHYVCYKAKPSVKPPKPFPTARTAISNPVFPEDPRLNSLAIKGFKWLCVPAAKVP
jgi:hypothetical protein